jgi:hypothetical protein
LFPYSQQLNHSNNNNTQQNIENHNNNNPQQIILVKEPQIVDQNAGVSTNYINLGREEARENIQEILDPLSTNEIINRFRKQEEKILALEEKIKELSGIYELMKSHFKNQFINLI